MDFIQDISRKSLLVTFILFAKSEIKSYSLLCRLPLRQVTVPTSTRAAGGTTPVARPTSTVCGTVGEFTAANSRTESSGPNTEEVFTRSSRSAS